MKTPHLYPFLITAFFAASLAACDDPAQSESANASKTDSTTKPQTQPAPAGGPTGAANIAAQIAGLTITEGRSGIEDGFVFIRGELKNGTNEWIAGRVLVTMLDAEGRPLAVDSIQTAVAADLGREAQELVVVERDVIPPGESSPFEYVRDVSKLGGSYASHRLVADGIVAGEVWRGSAIGVSSAFELGSFRVTGELESVGTRPCSDPGVVAAAYNGSGKLVEVEGIPLQNAGGEFLEQLDEGGKAAFDLVVRGESSYTIQVTAHCERPD